MTFDLAQDGTSKCPLHQTRGHDVGSLLDSSIDDGRAECIAARGVRNTVQNIRRESA
ncbi:hypothetical protein CBM2599_B20079 [Cupriavidus taiwanensis]|nr:hypothetical protein CBM2599_B20079 [Cupriavidus taiwanensis]SOY98544.1 hypothetical protein CBM2600_B30078 [Cupriavidus taiwanensis]